MPRLKHAWRDDQNPRCILQLRDANPAVCDATKAGEGSPSPAGEWSLLEQVADFLKDAFASFVGIDIALKDSPNVVRYDQTDIGP